MATGTLVSSLGPAADPAVRIMDYEYAQRRRTFVAIALTLVLGPAAFLLTRGDDEPDAAGPPITVVGTAAPVVGPPERQSRTASATPGSARGSPGPRGA